MVHIPYKNTAGMALAAFMCATGATYMGRVAYEGITAPDPVLSSQQLKALKQDAITLVEKQRLEAAVKEHRVYTYLPSEDIASDGKITTVFQEMQNRELGYIQETQSGNVAGSVVFGIIFAVLSSGLSGVAEHVFKEERGEERELATMRTRKKRKADFDALPDAEKVQKILLLEEMAEYRGQEDAEIVRIFHERNVYFEVMDFSLMKMTFLEELGTNESVLWRETLPKLMSEYKDLDQASDQRAFFRQHHDVLRAATLFDHFYKEHYSKTQMETLFVNVGAKHIILRIGANEAEYPKNLEITRLTPVPEPV